MSKLTGKPATKPTKTDSFPAFSISGGSAPATEAFSDLSTAPVEAPVEANSEAEGGEVDVEVPGGRRKSQTARFSERGLSTNSELLEVRRRATRQARGKSLLLACYIFVDLVYCLTRFIVLLPGVDPEIETTRYWKPFAILCTLGTEDAPGQIVWSKAWIGFVTWISYFIANVLLVIGVISLRLRFCYAYVTLKTCSMILHFLGLIIYGFDCNKETLVLEVSVFLVLHLPLQIMGVKLCHKMIRSLRRAKRGASILVRREAGTDVQRKDSFNSQKSSHAPSRVPSSSQGNKRYYTSN